MELIIQKSIELGANAIIPVEMKRCVVKLDSKSEGKKIERWQKIAESAAKQSGRNTVPEIRRIIKLEDIAKLKDLYDSIIVCYENEKNNYIKNELLKLKKENKQEIRIAIVIGPEGGLEEKDVQNLISSPSFWLQTSPSCSGHLRTRGVARRPPCPWVGTACSDSDQALSVSKSRRCPHSAGLRAPAVIFSTGLGSGPGVPPTPLS